MNEQNRLRLDRVATARAKQTPPGSSEWDADAKFLAAFGRVRDQVLRPVMAEVGAELEAAGYASRISPGGEEGSPAVDFHVRSPELTDAGDTIRFRARKDAEQGWGVIAELAFAGGSVELTRFEAAEQIAPEVAEQLLVDAVEQMFASRVVPPPGESPVPPPVALAEAGPTSELSAAPPASPTEGPHARFDLLPALERALDPALAPLLEAPEMRWGRWAGVQRMGETEEVDITRFRRAPLPFKTGAPTPAFFEAADAARAASSGPRASATGYETVVLPVLTAFAPKDEGGADEQGGDGRGRLPLTLEQYAAFCAELEVFPDQTAHIFQRYRVATGDARAALDHVFARAFQADPTLQRRWQALVAHYGGWYRAQAAR